MKDKKVINILYRQNFTQYLEWGRITRKNPGGKNENPHVYKGFQGLFMEMTNL